MIRILFILCAGLGLLSCTGDPTDATAPEIIEVGPDQVVIAWQGDSRRVAYWPIGAAHQRAEVTDPADTTAHEVRITGLESGGHYSYQVVDRDEVYHFQTEPPRATSVSFSVFQNVTEGELLKHLIQDGPGFMFTPSLLDHPALRPFVTVYDAKGNTARALREQLDASNQGNYRVKWGPLILAVGEDPGFLESQIKSLPTGYTMGVVTSRSVAEGLDFLPLRKHLEGAASIPAFVLVTDTEEVSSKDEVNRVGIGMKSALLKIIVDTESAIMVDTIDGRETPLRKAPLSSRRTCAECRRLADSGAYEASVTAYIEFIERNEGSHLIDDAYFEVANIYDEKLFNFTEAIKWYEALLAAYPNCSLAPFATERLKYFGGFSKEHFPVLERFEKIRRVTYINADPPSKVALIEELVSLSRKHAGTALAPEMLYWVGNQQREADSESALTTYDRLMDEYPTHKHGANAAYAAAETLYETGRYREAKAAYQGALAKMPDREATIAAQVARCDRNIRRHFLVWPATLLLAGALALAVIRRRHTRRRIITSGVTALAVGLATGIWAFTIREQFPSDRVAALLVLGFSMICGVIPNLVIPILISKRTGMMKTLALVLPLVATIGAAALYMLVYGVHEHYLTVFGL